MIGGCKVLVGCKGEGVRSKVLVRHSKGVLI